MIPLIDSVREARGLALARALCDKTDVVLENFRPGTMAQMGLGYEELRKTNPRITFASISGYGQTGVWRDRRAYAMLVHAEMGYMEGDARHSGNDLAGTGTADGDRHRTDGDRHRRRGQAPRSGAPDGDRHLGRALRTGTGTWSIIGLS